MKNLYGVSEDHKSQEYGQSTKLNGANDLLIDSHYIAPLDVESQQQKEVETAWHRISRKYNVILALIAALSFGGHNYIIAR